MNLKKARTYGAIQERYSSPKHGLITKVGDKVTFTLEIEVDGVQSMQDAKRIIRSNNEKMKAVVKNVFHFCQKKLKEKDNEQDQMQNGDRPRYT